MVQNYLYFLFKLSNFGIKLTNFARMPSMDKLPVGSQRPLSYSPLFLTNYR